ncbi:MAG TPA: histidine kinase dimerization/phosphoacceptor domain -containing protein, partial [Bacteroidia bacterium]|nr:histidine kinase dimerization/phosphoacceptor domain -containing protein [Bacteroidia bacterium]
FHDLAIKTHQQVKNEQVVASYNIYGSGSNGNDSWFKIQVKPVINNEVVTGIILISQIITEQYKNDEANAHFLSQLEATIESTADGILLVDKLGRVSLYNKKFLELWRIPPEILELRDDNSTLQYVVNQLKYPDDFLAKVQWLYDKPDEICFDVIEFIDGRVFERYSQAQLINGSYAGRVWSFRDITSRLQAEEAIKQSLQEKEVLLKEVHHRVKNNLQIISSIINLQAANINDPQTLEAMRDSQSRIRCMGYIHELLYQNKDFSSINFKEYISSIANSLLFTYSIGRQIQLKLSVQEIHLNIDVAIACGLIVNELLTNSLKYAFTIEHRNKYIEVTAAELDGKVVLTVADNGKGLEAGFDINNYETLGMQLVSGLVEQIDGALRVINKNGVLFEIEFFMTSKLQH